MTGGPALNLGEGKVGRWDGYYHADGPPSTTGTTLSTEPQPDGTVRVTTTGQVVDPDNGQELGALTISYDIRPDAEIGVRWTLNWTAPSTHLWEVGLRLSVPSDMSRMRWWRDSFFTDYPAGHLSESQGQCRAGSVLFRASKSDLHWLTLTRASGAGLTLLQNDDPLVGRAEIGSNAEDLLASSRLACAGPDDLSRSWFRDHEIVASAQATLSGSFVLRAIP
jgi:beta-galactosidase